MNRVGKVGLVAALVVGAFTVSVAVDQPASVDGACSIGTTTLRSGSSGPSVNCLERTLEALGFQSTYIDTYYRSTTVASVIAYQRANGLFADGVVGPLTGQSLGIWGGSTAPTTTAPPTTVPSTTGSCSIGTTTLRSGSSGPSVNCLERTLEALGFQSTYIDTYYRSTTVASVIAYQRANGLFADGVVGPLTGQSLGIWGGSTAPTTTAPPTTVPSTTGSCSIGTTTLRSGSSGPSVNCLERTLEALGFQSTYIDTYYRSTTVASVIAYQRANGLFADGVVGPQTGGSLGIWGGSATAPTTTTPATTTPSADTIKQIIRDAWPDELEDRAIEIAYRESRYIPNASNFCCHGLFQMYWDVHKVWLDDIGITSVDQLYDPATSARAAYALYQRAGGWSPWNI